jgi:Uma2 family endonuclease
MKSSWIDSSSGVSRACLRKPLGSVGNRHQESHCSRRDYSVRRPHPDDVLLVIEVSDSTLCKDRTTKGKLYVRAGIAEYWIVSLRTRSVEVRRDPEGDAYRTVQTIKRDQQARPLAFPDVVLAVSRLFPD